MANYRLRVGFSVGYTLSANAGSYTLTGIAAVLTYAGSGSNITSSVLTSRTGGAGVAGVAPLYVHFDATGTTSSDGNITNLTNGGTFRQISHAFDFGDTGSGTWTTTGNSRNSHSGGPLTAHVYETPGIYTVNVTHSAAGTPNKAATPIVITVSDPDVIYAGTATICIEGGSITGTGGPALCLYFATLAAAGGMASNKRFLFKKGQTHSASLGGSYSGVRVGSYGSTGGKPVVTSFQVAGGSGNNAFRDLDVRGTIQMMSNNNLSWNCDVTSDGSTPNIMLQTQEGDFNVCKYNCYGECTTTYGSGQADYGYFGTAAWTALLGVTTNGQGQHDTRIPNSYKFVLQNCRLKGNGADQSKASIKLHGGGTSSSSTTWNESSAGLGIYCSQYSCISNNILGSTTTAEPWTLNVDSQNDTSHEAVSDVIIENNQFYRGIAGTPFDMILGARRVTYRGNTSINGTMQIATGQNAPAAGFDGPYFSS